jgi:folate-binding Fe-S cluster repair protein YgfZ
VPRNDKEDQLAAAERDRQASQAAGHQATRQADADTATQRAEDAQADADLDPNSAEGRQAAMRRGDAVQLTGEERDRGMAKGTSTTSNESGAGFPAADDHNFVTGAAGVPVPASMSEPQVPGTFNPDMSQADTSGAGDVPVSAQEQAMAASSEPPAKSASKGDWVEYAVSQGMPQDEAEGKTKDELVAQYGG